MVPDDTELDVFMTYGPEGASGRVRVREWLAQTATPAQIHDYAGFPNNRAATLIRRPASVLRAEIATRWRVARRFHRVLISRGVSPFSSGGLIEELSRNSSLSVYDFDDALMWSPRGILDRLWSKSQNCIRAARSVDRVIAGNDTLADWALKYCDDVRLIPTCIDPNAFDPKTDYAIAGAPRMIWIGSPSTERYLSLIEGALHELNRATGARLTVVSSGNAALGSISGLVDRIQWRPGIDRQLGTFDVGIAPLVDSSWERGKCAYKVLQYGAAALPAVVSPIGANAQAANRLAFATATTQSEWVDSLLWLLSPGQASERQAMGASARAASTLHYSYSAWSSRWLDAVKLDPSGAS